MSKNVAPRKQPIPRKTTLYTKPIRKEEDYRTLNTYKVNLADLRMQVIELMKDGFTEVPLGDLLYIIRHM